jgi:uncharacterized protein (TIGR00269 family)
MKCARCRRFAGEIELPYMKEFVCAGCFLSMMENRVRKNIRANRLLGSLDRTAVALSGGKDSAVTLHILKVLHAKAPRSELSAITIDQGIKGTEDGLKAAKELCKRLGVEHHIFSFRKEYGIGMDALMKKVKKIDNSTPACSFCGVLRRNLLNEKARELGLTKVATGHNLDDEAQSSLMNYLHGDVERLSRMGPKVGVIRDPAFVPRIKPLRDCPEDEVLKYAKLQNIPFSPSQCPYSKEAFRDTVRKALGDIEKRHPGTKFQLLNSTDHLIPLLRKSIVVGTLTHCSGCGEITSGELCRVCQIRKELDF